jgi:hypothetical protein
MANSASVVANSRTPLSVVLDINNNGTAGATFPYTRTNLLTALMPGPLKAFLTGISDWTVLNFGGALTKHIRFSSVFGGSTSSIPTTPGSMSLVWAANELDLGLDPNVAAATRALVELRLLDSSES